MREKTEDAIRQAITREYGGRGGCDERTVNQWRAIFCSMDVSTLIIQRLLVETQVRNTRSKLKPPYPKIGQRSVFKDFRVEKDRKREEE